MSSDHQLFSRAIRMARPDAYPVPGAPPEPKSRPNLARRRLEALVFVNLGPGNEGLPSSVRKEGPAFQAMKRLAIDQKLSVVFKLAGIEGWLRATGKVVWLSHSGTAGGLQLVDMPGESRRVVDLWFSTREQTGRADAASGSQMAPAGVGAPVASTDFGLESYQIVLPVEAIEIAPGPAQRGQRLAHVVVQANARAATPAIEANFGNSVAVPQSKGLTGSPEAARIGAPRKSFKIERKTAKSFALVMGVLLAIFFVGGIIMAEFRLGLPARLAEAMPVEAPSTPAAAPLPPADADQNSYAAPPSKSAIMPEPALAVPPETAAQAVSEPAKVEKPAPLAAPGVPVRAARQPESSGSGRAQQIARAGAPSAAVLPAASTRRVPAPVATPPAAAVTATLAAPANPLPERPAEAAAPVAAAEKAPSPAPAPAASPEIPSGSVEVIADPYPSLRAPAEPQPRASKAAALTIGRLVSVVEPVYPPDALRQRIFGTVKLHVVRGTNGEVETATVTDGPMPLRNAALQAVRQWRYEPTLLGSTPVEAEEDIAVVFRMTNATGSPN
jgi:protein TonB